MSLPTCTNNHPTLWPKRCPLCKADSMVRGRVSMGYLEKRDFNSLLNAKISEGNRRAWQRRKERA
jgi:hypothetical protein